VYADGRCSRLCAGCSDRLVETTIEREAELNRPSSWFAMALPLIFLYVSCGWMVLWWLVDMALIWANTDRIVLRTYGCLLLLAALAVIALVIGCPIGLFLRRSGFPGRTHWLASTAVVLLACAAGEYLYVTTLIYRQTGSIDLNLAALVVIPLVTGYQPI